MGQGYSQITLPAGPSAIEISELSDISYEKSLGGARFLKTVRARHQNGVVVAKVCQKANTTVSFKHYVKLLRQERQALRDIPNVLPYARVRETSTLGVLVRQFIHTSLYDRISIRPFLEEIEKKWIAFQLLCALRDCHAQGVFHGDIKSENVLVTSWGWVYLTDFASAFKPVYLPEDNPADFSFYYDTSARRTCYLAPERFLAAGDQPNEGNVVQWNMDIFSLGCVLAELFTEAPTFTLSQLFRYRKGEYDPTVSLLNKIDDDSVRSLITSMIRLDPTERWHASDYLDEYKEKAFPLYFYNHLHTLMQEITTPSPVRKPVVAPNTNTGESDERIDRIYDDFEMLSVSLGYQEAINENEDAVSRPLYLRSMFPLQIDLPNSRHAARSDFSGDGENGTFILLNVVTASMRSCARASSKIRGCELLLAFAERLPDEAKLDRILPYIMPLLDDNNDMVLLSALRTMTQLLALVEVVSPVNSFLFTQYIFPRLQVFVKGNVFKNNALVRATYAACLASLAETASRFLDILQALRADGSLPSADKGADADDGFAASQDDYDAIRLEILDQFEAQTKVFLTDTDNAVRRAFLTSVSSLCVFLGEVRAADVILSHLNTYLNDPDWLLKCSFFKTIVGVAVYIGSANLEEFILPLMLQALADPQEFVVEQALRSLATMAEMGLLQRSKTWELIDTIARFQMHPNLWIREAASHFVSAATTYLSMADVRILVAPLIQPYLKVPMANLTELELLDALQKPIPRSVLDLAVQWATRVDRSIFWKAAKDSKQLSYATTGQMPPQSSVAGLGPKSMAKVPKTDEDQQWLGRLRNAGMRSEDEVKLLAFREYIWRAAQRSKRNDAVADDGMFEQLISLTKLGVTPQTVIFDNDAEKHGRHVENHNSTIAEAIEDAAKNRTADPDPKHDTEDQESVNTVVTTTADPTNPLAIHRLSGLRNKASDSLSSSPSSGIGLLGKDFDGPLRHRGSGNTLTGIDVRSKALAAVSTDEATAAGRLNAPGSDSRRTSPTPNAGERRRVIERAASQRAVHNYAGNDPAVLRLLDAVYIDNFSIDAGDFGPLVQPCTGAIPGNNSGQNPAGPWRPQGQLLGILAEHTAKICRIVPSPDHLFFLTGSDDGSIRIWDSSRLETNVTHRSRQLYRLAEGVKVTSLCFIEATHSFVCTGSDGSVHAVRVDVTKTNSTTKYSKLRLIREWQIPGAGSSGEYVVWSEHHRGESASTLVMATIHGRILALDIRYMSLLFDLRNPPQHGTPTCFCMSRRHDWLLIGTSHGVLDLWDVRFQVRVRSWTFANPSPITRLQLLPGRKSSKRNRFCVTGGTAPGDVTVWEPEKGVCYELYRSAHTESKDRLHARDYEFRNIEDEKSTGALGFIDPAAESTKVEQNSNLPNLTSCSIFSAQPSPKDPDISHIFAIAGGPDHKVRFWDCERLDGCRLVSGGSLDEKPTYTFSQLSQDTRVVSEKAAEAIASAGVVESNKVASNSSGKRAINAGTNRLPSRYETIRLTAQNLLQGHLDTITDVALLERPFGMVLSADRSGQIFIHQ